MRLGSAGAGLTVVGKGHAGLECLLAPVLHTHEVIGGRELIAQVAIKVIKKGAFFVGLYRCNSTVVVDGLIPRSRARRHGPTSRSIICTTS